MNMIRRLPEKLKKPVLNEGYIMPVRVLPSVFHRLRTGHYRIFGTVFVFEKKIVDGMPIIFLAGHIPEMIWISFFENIRLAEELSAKEDAIV